MEIVTLTGDNIQEFSSYTDGDIAENIGRKYYRGLIAVKEEIPMAGMIWRYIKKDPDKAAESNIEWFRISDREAARELLEAYAAEIAGEGVARSNAVIPVKDKKTEKEVLKEAGFSIRLTESDNVVVKLSELSSMPLMKIRNVPYNIYALNLFTARKFRKGIAKCVAMGRTGLCDDLADLPMSFFEEDVSVCYENDGELNSFLLFHMMPSGILSIQLMLCLDKDYKAILPGMMRVFVSNMEGKYPPDVRILLNRHNEYAFMLSEKLLPRSFGIPVYAGSREEPFAKGQ